MLSFFAVATPMQPRNRSDSSMGLRPAPADLFSPHPDSIRGLHAAPDEIALFLDRSYSAVTCAGSGSASFRPRSTSPADPLISREEVVHQIVVPEFDDEAMKEFIRRAQLAGKEHALTPIQAGIVVKRGMSAGTKLAEFLNPDLSALLPPPETLKGYSEACALAATAVRLGLPIALCSDYDADGNCSAATLFRLFSHFRARCAVFQPDRVADGYGLNRRMIERIAADGYGLLIATDFGIVNKAEIALARERNIATIVIDHHELQAGKVAEPDVLIDPKQPGCGYAGEVLCAAPLAWLVARGVAAELGCDATGKSFDAISLLPYSAIATLADLSPLTSLNRAIVKEGLRELGHTRFPGLRKLAGKLSAGRLDSDFASFLAGPAFNACGRILARSADGNPGTAPVLELLTTDDPDRADHLAQRLIEVNDERKAIELNAVDRADFQLRKRLKELGRTPAGIAIAVPEAHEGVVGLGASRFQDSFYCPVAFMGRRSDGVWKGSARSIPGIHLMEILADCAPYLEKFGGHEMAAGFTVKSGFRAAEKFMAKFEESCARRLGDRPRMKQIEPDLIMTLPEILRYGPDLVHELAFLEPCGQGVKAATVLIPAAHVRRAELLKEQHLALEIVQDGAEARAFFFHRFRHPALAMPGRDQPVNDRSVLPQRHEPVDIVCRPMVDRWFKKREGRELKLQIVAARLTDREW